MENVQIMYLISFVLGIMAVTAPIIKLNNSITRLNTTMENMERQFCDNEKKLDVLDDRVDKHETRITVLENRG